MLKKENELIRGNFWGFNEKIQAKNCEKIKFRGMINFLGENLIKILRKNDLK